MTSISKTLHVVKLDEIVNKYCAVGKYDKELQEENENVIKRKGEKLYVKWKGYDSSAIK